MLPGAAWRNGLPVCVMEAFLLMFEPEAGCEGTAPVLCWPCCCCGKNADCMFKACYKAAEGQLQSTKDGVQYHGDWITAGTIASHIQEVDLANNRAVTVFHAQIVTSAWCNTRNH